MRIPAALLLLSAALPAFATDLGYQFYDMGAPALTDLWVDPAAGNDGNSGASRAQALRTLNAAWNLVPTGTLTQGYRILLAAGSYPQDQVPLYFEGRQGSADHPLVIQAADADGSALLPPLNIFGVRYFYLIGVRVDSAGQDVFHCEQCDHLLLKRSTIRGQPPASNAVQEAVKINQSSNVFIEENDISGAWDNAIDFVAVQGARVLRNRVHDAGDWCEYAKGGSSYLVVAGNEYYDCGTGGFTAGQGTGFEFMVWPWLHYEAYDIKFVNNVVHDTQGAGFGVNGGYNVLMAYNTLYRVGSRSHGIEVVYGHRSCDGNTAQCAANVSDGGWGPAATGVDVLIPNRNVFIYDNVLYNPAGVQSAYQHFSIAGAAHPVPGSNLSDPIAADANLQIRGNVIWNGPSNLPLGIGTDSGCQDGNPTCSAAQLVAENTINQIEPELIDPAHGDFRPLTGGNLFNAMTFTPPDFGWSDAPAMPPPPAGNPANGIIGDRNGAMRTAVAPPGAFTVTADSDADRVLNWAEHLYPDLARPGGGSSATAYGYYYRYYSGSNAYVGVKDGRAWYLPASGVLQDVGAFSDFLGQAAAAGW